MKILHAIVVIIFSSLITLSGGGFNIFTHYCHKTGDRIFSFQEPEECEHEHGTSCETSDYKHNHAHINTNHCCEDKHSYIKTISNISHNDNCPKIIAETYFNLILDLIFLEPISIVPYKYFYSDFSSPPEFNPKFIPIKNHNLKIDCI